MLADEARHGGGDPAHTSFALPCRDILSNGFRPITVSARCWKRKQRGPTPATGRRGRLPGVSEDRVRVRIGANGVATVTMVRSDKHNALDQAMFEGLMNAAEQLANDASVRVVVLHGEGKSSARVWTSPASWPEREARTFC